MYKKDRSVTLLRNILTVRPNIKEVGQELTEGTDTLMRKKKGLKVEAVADLGEDLKKTFRIKEVAGHHPRKDMEN